MKLVRWKNTAAEGDCVHFAGSAFRSPDYLMPHGHDLAEIFWITRESGTHVINGEASVMQTGSLCLVRPGDVHELRPGRGGSVGLSNVAFPAARFEWIKKGYAKELKAVGELPQSVQLSVTARAELEAIAFDLGGNTGSQLATDRFLLHAFWLLLSSGGAREEDLPEWLRTALAEIEKPRHFCQGAAGFVELCGKSPEHAARVCRRLLDSTPVEIANRARIKYATAQLAATARPILDIAYDCGFRSLSHFYTVFRNATGTTPRQARLNGRSTVPSAKGNS